MTTQRIETAEERPLDILGIGETEEHAYRWLLAHSDTTVQTLAQALTLTPGKTQRLLDTLAAKGLVTHSPERPRRYIPAAPDIALKALVHRRQESLQRAEGIIEELQEQSATRRHGKREQMVELITSREAERQVFEQMHRGAQHEVLTLVRPPILISKLEALQDNETQRDAQARGVSYQAILNAEYLALPGAVRRTREDMKGGEEIRVLPHLPFKMILTDHRVALIPLSLEESDSPVLLVRSSALLEALYALFGALWERASPLSFTHAGEPAIGDSGSRLPEGTEDLLSLMAAGLNDKKIAREMGLSLRTLYRRIGELMKSLDARTRFQFGWLAALRMSGIGGMESNAGRTP